MTSSSDVPENISLTTLEDDAPRATSKQGARSIPSFSVSSQIGDAFTKWLTGSGGGYKKDRPAQQIVSRCFKFLKFCCEEEEVEYWILACAPQACCLNLLTFYKTSASLDTADDWVT